MSSVDEVVSLSGPDGLRERLPIRRGAGEGHWSYGPVTTSGVYDARSEGNARRYAVNVNPRESDLVRFDPELLPAQLRREPVTTTESMALAETGSIPHFRWLLGTVLVLLIIDPLLAWHFARGRG